MISKFDPNSALEIWGIIDGMAPAGVGNGTGGMDLVVELAGWKHPGEELHTAELRIRMPIPSEHEIRDHFDLFRPYDLVRLKGKMQSNESGLPEEFIAEEMVVSALDEECHAFSLELQKPVTIQDPLFGDLVLDRSLNWFTGKAIWEEVIVPITFSVEGPMKYGLEAASLEPLVTIGRDLLTHQTEWLANIKSCIFGEIFSYINEMLVQLGESPISLADFQNRLSLKSIIVHKPDLIGFNFEFGNTWLFGFDIGISLSEGIYDWKIHM